MKIKNYTTAISVEKTVSSIEQELVKIGVSKIEKKYKDGKIDGIIFSVQLEKEFRFKIPANHESAFRIIKKISEYKNKKNDWLEAQSRRTAWRIVYNWVQLQVAMIQLEQAEALQVFLPYIYDEKNDTTFYDQIVNNKYKAITYDE